MKEINANIRRMRIERGITQEQMAELLNIKRFSYNKKELHGNFSAKDIAIIAKAFNVTPETILGDKKIIVLNDNRKPSPIADLAPLNLSAKERKFMLNVKKLPKKQFEKLYKQIEDEVKSKEEK